MNITCTIGFHKWDGCKCIACEKVRDERHEWNSDCELCTRCGKTRTGAHTWDGCKCSTCGKMRDEGHSWINDCELCARCGKVLTGAHKWDGCKCTACGKVRDEGHYWNKDCELCSRCGKTRTGVHKWNGCKCSACEKVRDEGHNWINDCGLCAGCGKTRTGSHKWDGCVCTTCGKMRNEEHDWPDDSERCTKCGAYKPYVSKERYSAELLRAKGHKKALGRDISNATALFQQAIRTDESFAEAYRDLARLMADNSFGTFEIRILLYEEAIKNRRDYIIAINDLCLHLLYEKQFERTIQLIEDTLKLDLLKDKPLDILSVHFLRLMSLAYERKGDIANEALVTKQIDEISSNYIQESGPVIRTENDNREYIEFAQTELRSGNIQKAINLLRTGIVQDDGNMINFNLWEALANIYLQSDMYSEALSCMILLEDSRPFMSEGCKLSSIARLYHELGQEAASEYYQQLATKTSGYAFRYSDY